jgi:Tol biopolymer transport system component
MMPTDRIDRQLPSLLDELAQPRVPDYFDDLLGLTVRTRQRPAWVFPKRWIPMLEIARQPVVAQPPWRAFGLLLLLIGVVAAGLVLAATRPKPPPLFGPAGNGLIVMSRDGDILTTDPRTGVETVIVAGPETDRDPVWSQDGTKLLFRRDVPGVPGAGLVMTARANGTGVKQLTPEPMTALTASDMGPTFAHALHYSLSLDATRVAIVATVKGIPALFIGDTDGQGLTRMDLPAIPFGAWFDPTGKKILFVGAQGFDGYYSGLYSIGVDGSNPVTLVEPQLDAQVWSRAYWSPDGTRIAYARRVPGFTAGEDGRRSPIRHDLRVHVIGADGTGDVVVGHKDGAWWEAPHGWSPDGQSILIERSLYPDSETEYLDFGAAIIDPDARRADVDMEFAWKYEWDGAWSPDGTSILVTPDGENGERVQQQLWDARTGKATQVYWTGTSFPSWQRVGLP